MLTSAVQQDSRAVFGHTRFLMGPMGRMGPMCLFGSGALGPASPDRYLELVKCDQLSVYSPLPCNALGSRKNGVVSKLRRFEPARLFAFRLKWLAGGRPGGGVALASLWGGAGSAAGHGMHLDLDGR